MSAPPVCPVHDRAMQPRIQGGWHCPVIDSAGVPCPQWSTVPPLCPDHNRAMAKAETYGQWACPVPGCLATREAAP